MADLTPNVEVILTSDLFDDDPCFESMSASALAILDAYLVGFGWLDGPTKKDCLGIAAALRAAADQVVPTEMDLPPIAPDLGHFRQHERRLTRQRLLAIAAELEGAGA